MKGHFVSPMVLGRRMPLNTVAILLSLLFWGWVWGIVGVIVAVPLTVMIQVICSHSERFRGVALCRGIGARSVLRESPLAGLRTSS